MQAVTPGESDLKAPVNTDFPNSGLTDILLSRIGEAAEPEVAGDSFRTLFQHADHYLLSLELDKDELHCP